jgi:hypothetical protein
MWASTAAGRASVSARLEMGGGWRAICAVLEVHSHYSGARGSKRSALFIVLYTRLGEGKGGQGTGKGTEGEKRARGEETATYSNKAGMG